MKRAPQCICSKILMMGKPRLLWSFFLLITTVFTLSLLSAAVDPPEVGSAARYDSPYAPNVCGYDEEHLPSGGHYGAVDEDLWKNGTACGATYEVRCVDRASSCVYGTSINVTVIDRLQQMVSTPSSFEVRFALSSLAYDSIADPAKDSITIQFQQLS